MDAETPPSLARRLGALVGFLLLSPVCGVLVAALFLPPLHALTRGTTTATSVWADMSDDLPDTPAPQRSVMLDNKGKVFATFYVANRVPVASSAIAKVMKDAQVSIEDTRFYDHGAMDALSFLRALSSMGSAGGGSTITQQYVKNVRLYAGGGNYETSSATARTVTRKLQELRIAEHVEQTMTKDQILTGYLNIVNYGGGTYGVQAASEHWFGHSASTLTLPEAALLAGVVQNPTAYDPSTHPTAATKRRNVVLADMLKANRITRAQYNAAVATPLRLKITQPASGCGASRYPYYCQQVLAALAADTGLGATKQAREAVLNRGGLTVHTSLDTRVQAAAQTAANKSLGSTNQYATGIAIVQPGTGQVLAIAQNRTWKQTQVSYPTSGFQNGSTFKPITLAAALGDGWNIADTLTARSSITVNGMTFHNQAAHDAGTMTAYDALAISSNTFFVALETQHTTVAHVQALARQLGWSFPSGTTGTEAATTLGVYNVSPVTVANAYATFAAAGRYCNPTWVTSIVGPQAGKAARPQLAAPDADCHQVMSTKTALTVANALTQTISGSNPYRTGKSLSIGRQAMGKTGTTTSNSAVWFAGGTPQYASAVWVGDPRGGFAHPVDQIKLYGSWTSAVYGSTTAGPIWQQAMKLTVAGTKATTFALPSAVASGAFVPDTRGMTVDHAVAVLTAAGQQVSIAATTGGYGTKGTVTSQSVAGRKVVLTLAPGSDTHVVIAGNP